MKYQRWLLATILCLLSLQSSALIIVDVVRDVPLETGYTGFSTNMREHGYNPNTDIAHSITLFLSFREIVDDGDDWDAGTMEFLIFHAMPWGYRELVYADIDTETIAFGLSWAPGEDTCAIWDMDDNCTYDPVKSGNFGIAMTNYSTNLAMNEVRWELEVTRTAVSEPSMIILLLLSMLGLGNFCRKACADK
ncbi:PEP-CTERM sorting domain-containing protein [Cellvibrio mixtus]|uniref:PEP-CTERM sorting domain-containing protein n=1 Tax=Cellvibrio mixtus TaxID=39650 RepID=UPI000586BA29|nr:PEP-CTERM sorting domain-containing protein [Cellvibrio mixtus]